MKTNVLIVKYLEGSVYIQKYDEKDKRISNQKEHFIKKKGDVFEKIMMNGNHCFILFSRYNKENNEDILFYNEIDVHDLSISEDKVLISTQNRIKGFEVINGYILSEKRMKYNISYSNDSSNILVQYRLHPKEKDDNLNKDIIGLSSFNSDLERNWNKEIEMPFVESKINNLDYEIDNKGYVYILCEKYRNSEARNYADNKFNKDLLLFKIDKGEIVNELLIDDNDLVYDDFVLLLKDEKILALGEYSGSHYGKEYKNDLTQNSLLVIDFNIDDEDFNINYIHDLKYETKASDGINLSRVDIEQNVDGSFLLIEEKGSFNELGNEYFSYNSIHFIKLSKNYDVDWNVVIPKWQISNEKKYNASFHYVKKEDYAYFFYVDILKNREEVVKACLNLKVDDLICQKISLKDGTIEKKSVVFNFYDYFPKNKIKKILTSFSTDKFIETETGVAFEVSDQIEMNMMIHVDF